MIRPVSLLIPAWLWLAASTLFARPLPVEGPLVLEQGDLVVMLGDTFIERDGNYGFLEAAVTAAYPGKALKFRNLGWSGDTPRAESRAYFGPPAEGFDRLRQHLAELKPTVVISCYGAVDSWKGPSGLEGFLRDYGKLLDMVRDTTGSGLVLMSPPAVQPLPPPFPDMSGHAKNLAEYSAAISGLARERGLRYADLFGAMAQVRAESENGVTFTANGYATITPAFLQALGVPSPRVVPEALRAMIVEKNRVYFYRWRPQNEIYLFGSRKHEQGNNASEVQLFEPIVSKMEAAIHLATGSK